MGILPNFILIKFLYISEYRHDGIPLWEKKYCTLMGRVPWQKIVDSKKLIYCHNNVLNWKDSAAEEAFQNAKKRYWDKINSLPCDISLPDPDAYIEQIDWNPCIDPELIKELDKAFFTLPDEEQENVIKNKRTKISVDGENPWECAAKPFSRASENNEVQWQNQGDYHDNSENADTTDNPWESNGIRGNGGLISNAGEGGHVKSWGWNEGRDDNNQCKDWNSGCLQIDKGWGKTNDSAWCQQRSNNSPNIGNSWEYKSTQQNVIPTNTGWRNNDTNVSRWKPQEKPYVSSDSQFRRNIGGWTAGNHRNQIREGSNRHDLGYNGSQFQRDDSQTGHYWRREQSRKRDFRS
ncbi:uncharacterized protein [Cicer arietinum]|uniref:uncharacterized protein isoform X2 n=1 Tax=Cicer arietinum TaxID=3827 RepID=UPI003CC55A6E